MLNKLRRRFFSVLAKKYQHPAEPQLVLDNKLLQNKNVLITGAGRNIGKSIAVEMAKQGANIYFTEQDKNRFESLQETLKTYPILTKGFFCDSAQMSAVNQLVEELDHLGETIDILINNAGIQFEKSALKAFDSVDWEKTYNNNIIAPLYLTKCLTDRMVKAEKSGTILFITSIHQWHTRGWSSYSSSKAALGMLVKELALELADKEIRVNGIAPGWVETDALGQVKSSKYTPLYQCSIPPKYIGRAAVFLASDYFSHHTTGSILTVDGGMSLFNFQVAQSFQGRQ